MLRGTCRLSLGAGTALCTRQLQPRQCLLSIRRSINNKIFIRGLPDNITEEQLGECLSCYGEIKTITLHEFKLRSLSAVVAFKNINAAFSAIDELQNSLLMGRRISIDFALPANRSNSNTSNNHVNNGGKNNTNTSAQGSLKQQD